jgi:type IV secretion system protein VirB10
MADTPSVDAPSSAPSPDGTAPVTDHRPVPRGVLPRGVQTWLLAGLAVFMLAIMFVVGRPTPPARPAAAPVVTQAPNADRVRDYQERLRQLDAQALANQPTTTPSPATVSYHEPDAAAAEDPIAVDRRRREYESLFASNVVLSRRAGADRPEAARARTDPAPDRDDDAPPSVDDIAEAVVRATTRAGAASVPATRSTSPPSSAETPATDRSGAAATRRPTGPIAAAGSLHRVLEGTVLDAVLTNRLDGSSAAPVNALVTNPLYSHSGQHVLVPAGARVLGTTRPVQAFGETRLAVSFHRLLMPDGRTYPLDQFSGLNQIGDAGLRDRVNTHYLSTFGAAAAVGLISGLSQFVGGAGVGSGDGDRTVVIAGGIGDATSQASVQVMHRFLNRLPTITIREGHRLKVYLTSDLELPAYGAAPAPGSF